MFNQLKPSKELPVIAWWSGGVTSAVACWIAITMYGPENVRVVFMDTKNEDEDTYRFFKDCEKWYGVPIEVISRGEYSEIKEVWYKFKSLNVANGAICSSELKRDLRLQFQENNSYSYHIFGFDMDEPKRAKSMSANHKLANPIFPLLLFGFTKKDCIEILRDNGIEIPRAYYLGFSNNNCLKTGCVQGGIGYWQKMRREYPMKFEAMAKIEHDLTALKGKPVTMLKDQGKSAGLVFLLPNPMYPGIKDISMMNGREPEPLLECNGFCGTNDLETNKTQAEINFAPIEE
jgi:3'-phosphoadenosine 5'-phosphosulfate sulfotransferase (PAPS reductase)/FAD synthetase